MSFWDDDKIVSALADPDDTHVDNLIAKYSTTRVRQLIGTVAMFLCAFWIGSWHSGGTDFVAVLFAGAAAMMYAESLYYNTLVKMLKISKLLRTQGKATP
jgi:hypothetical protein